MFVAQATGSVFNILYNLTHLAPLLTENQAEAFARSINAYNLSAYPILVGWWGYCVFRLRRPARDRKELRRQQRRVIDLPLHAALIATIGWIACLPALLLGLVRAGEPLAPHIHFHLPVSLGIAMVIALTIGYFSIDVLRQVLLFPGLFPDRSPSQVKGAFRLSIVQRGRITMVAGSVCPIVALLLLQLSPAPEAIDLWFAVAVAVGGIACAVITSALLGRAVYRPVDELRAAAQEVGRGNLDVSVDAMRADEFGILATEFNAMVAGLREKDHVVSTFGRHVGKKIARELLRSEEDLRGVERTLTVLFADIRGFTTRCEGLSPARAVHLLNLYHEHMTTVIENHEGIVNQLVGDGLMALFGATGMEEGMDDSGARSAVSAGREMVSSLEDLNQRLDEEGYEPVRIGVGIHTGPAVVGTIGSPRRMEYTAIGDTVNTTARIEGMTKEAGHPLLISSGTWEALAGAFEARALEPREVRGRREKIVLYAVAIPGFPLSS